MGLIDESAEDGKASELKEETVLLRVELLLSSVSGAKRVDEVICSLYSFAVLLFPGLDSSTVIDCIDNRYRDQVLGVEAPPADQRSSWWELFYKGPAFSLVAGLLLFDVAPNWLPCFPISVRKHVYDMFFIQGRTTNVIHSLVSSLQQNGSSNLENDSVYSNVERLLVLCLFENSGVLRMAREFAGVCITENLSTEQLKPAISRAAQLLTSVPDKARSRAPALLQSRMFFKQITIQLLAGAEEWDHNLHNGELVLHSTGMDAIMVFVGEAFTRTIRRGSGDALLMEVISQMLAEIRGVLLSVDNLTAGEEFGSRPGFGFWSKITEAIKDSHALERLSEQLLKQLAVQSASDIEAYWILWILFDRVYECRASIRYMFIEKFLLWKVFPVCCLRWILHFAVIRCPPGTVSLMNGCNKRILLNTLQHLVTVWSKREFVQSAPIEQQIYITAALGICLEKITKDDLDTTKDAMQGILEGVSCRLENPADLVRKMASNVALAFSKVIDPKNPLYLDDSCREEILDWEFGLATSKKVIEGKPQSKDDRIDDEKDAKETVCKSRNNVKGRKKTTEFELVDPDEIIDPGTLGSESVSDEEDAASENSEASSDTSLQPYDLSDDDTDLQRKFSQLVDVVGALRKSDDPDGVEKALDVAEKLVRASPDELRYVAGDLVRTLVYVRCSDFTVEGEEESVEDKRQKALVALITTSPFESLDTLCKLLYSPNLDISQRLLILDVMIDAAQELAKTKTSKIKHPQKPFISFTSESQPWYLPGDRGPPGAGPWKEISGNGSHFNWAHSYERDLPPKSSQVRRGKTHRWSLRSSNLLENYQEWSQNKLPQYVAAFMLPAMQGFDKKRHGVDLLGRDFIVLGKLIYMLGVCMKCTAMHPEASVLASPLLDMLSSREISHHAEAYVRRSVLFAASCILVAIHPSHVASALVDGNFELLNGLEWVRSWALHVAESDTDKDCYTMSMTCLQLHAEMSLQASRAMESTESISKAKSIGIPSDLSKGIIKIPHTSLDF